ncbi:iron-containing alcohol dehydrogenase [Natranaerofaba carboxydovora]|uniref:iron-containing alcohol dehydrogenase n=1 Tax=Natranaerofaba carboxydovora TaxID=2742683 RepID=UPI001F140D07|nr:iron-containing alcohol dehydrogenase [Natranaerofaba carboxydovora]UMZ74192.1 1,3-propanediol dehydrogenase [Natranaerofaba carboxydovora]
MEKTYSFFMPTVNLMGPGTFNQAGERMKSLNCKKALIVTDKGIKDLGMADELKEVIKKEGLEAVVYADTAPNPTDKNVAEGEKMFKDENCDIVVSLGGGSSHDCGKGVRIVASNGGNIRDYEGLDQSEKADVPMIAINTTAGTASEMTRFCIITDTERKIKMAIVDWRTTPDVSINDPLTMMKKPPQLTAATGMDALTHAVEGYVSVDHTPVTDAVALKAIRLISENLRTAVANGDDFEARDNMAYAQFLAGMAFNNAGLGFVHAMAHQLGGFYDLPHGVCNAILLPHVESFNLIASPERFKNIAEAMGENVEGLSDREAAEVALEAIKTLSVDIGIPEGLEELGVKEKDVQIMAENAMKDVCSLANPRKAKLEDIVEIFKGAI